MTPFTLRDAAPADLPAIVRLIRGLAEYERLLHEVTVTEADLRPALFGPQPRLQATLAEVGAERVGLALFYYTFNTFKARPNIFLEDLFVEPAHRGKGIGLALMRHLARKAVAEGCRLLEWRVLHWNQPSIDFYERLGARAMQDWQTRQLDGDALAALAHPLTNPLAHQNPTGEQHG
ncbi:MAG TPA: GNAT family N-acetyltransferase [Rhodopila sp.]|nr:GNAT family N-acetyltransferase [Rhodopila sp.]